MSIGCRPDECGNRARKYPGRFVMDNFSKNSNKLLVHSLISDAQIWVRSANDNATRTSYKWLDSTAEHVWYVTRDSSAEVCLG